MGEKHSLMIDRELASIELIVDTNICSYEMADHRSAVEIAERYRDVWSGRNSGLSFQSVAELRVGLELQGWDLARFEQLMSRFTPVGLNSEVVDAYVSIQSEAARRGRDEHARRSKAGDCWIAATALSLGVPLLTHNARDFRTAEALGLAVISHPEA